MPSTFLNIIVIHLLERHFLQTAIQCTHMLTVKKLLAIEIVLFGAFVKHPASK